MKIITLLLLAVILASVTYVMLEKYGESKRKDVRDVAKNDDKYVQKQIDNIWSTATHDGIFEIHLTQFSNLPESMYPRIYKVWLDGEEIFDKTESYMRGEDEHWHYILKGNLCIPNVRSGQVAHVQVFVKVKSLEK